MTRRTKLRILVGTVGLFAALIVAAVLVVNSAWFRDWLRGQIVTRAAAAIDGELDLQALTGSLFRDVTLHGVAIRQDGRVVVSAATIAAHYDPWQLIKGNIQIDNVTLTEPVVRLERDGRGWNLARLVRTDETPEPASAPRTVHISRIVLRGGQVSAVTEGERIASVSQVDLEATLHVDAAGTAIDIERASLVDDVSRAPVSALEAAVRLDDAGVAVDGIRLEAPGVAVRGQVRVPAEPGDLDLDVAATLDDWQAASVAPYLPEGVAALPPVSGDIGARGTLEALVASWTLAIGDAASTGEVRVNAAAEHPSVTGRVTARRIDPAVLVRRRDLEGSITATLDIDAAIDTETPAASRATFHLTGGPIALMGYRATSLQAEGQYRDEVLDGTARVNAYGAATTATVHAANVAGSGPLTLSASGRIANLDVAALPSSLGAPEIKTAITGRYSARLVPDGWSASVDLDESRIDEATVGAGATIRAEVQGTALTASLAGDVVNLSTASLMAGEEPSVVGGHVEASVALPDMARPFGLETLETAEAHARIQLADSVIYGTELARADVDASLSGGLLSVRQLDVDSGAVTLTATGDLAVAGTAATPSTLAYDATVADMTMLPPAWVEGLRGGAHVKGTVGGSSDDPTTTGEIELFDVGYGETANALSVTSTFDVRVPDRDIAKLSADLETHATFVEVGGQQLQAVALTSRYEARKLDLTARLDQDSRALEVDGSVALFPDYREVVLRNMSIAGLGEPWRLAPAEGGTAIRYGTDDVRVRGLTFVRDTERLAVEGVVGLPDRGVDSNVVLDFSGLRVGDLLTLATGTPRVTGTANGRVTLTGAIADPAVDAAIDVLDGDVSGVVFTRAHADVALAQRQARVTARVEEPNGAALTAEGVVPVGAGDGALDLRVASSGISLGLLAGATTHLDEVTGTAGLDLHVGGTYGAPVLSGTVALADAAFTVVPTGVRYSDVALETRLDGGRMVIERASIADEDGHVATIAGSANVLPVEGDERTVDVRLQAAGIHVLSNELGEVELTVDARAQGSLMAPSVTGRVAVDRGRLEVDQLLQRFGGAGAPIVPDEAASRAAAQAGAPSPDEPAVPVPPTPEPESAADVAPGEATASKSVVDIAFELPDNLVLRGRNIRTATGSMGLGDMNMTVGGTFAVRKESDAPMRVVGAVEVVRGFYEFQGRRFEVTEGSDIRFQGTDTINPQLNVVAQRDVQGIIARVEVTGTAQRPRIALSSQPPLDEGDVLSLIVFNQPMSQLGQSEQVDLMDRAGDMALGALATSLADSIGRALNVDLFEIRAPSSGGAGEVSVGNQVSNRLFVGFRQELGAAGASRLSFEYRLTELLRLLTSVGQGAERGKSAQEREAAGLDLVFRLRY